MLNQPPIHGHRFSRTTWDMKKKIPEPEDARSETFEAGVIAFLFLKMAPNLIK